jgi:hypothetical protein
LNAGYDSSYCLGPFAIRNSKTRLSRLEQRKTSYSIAGSEQASAGDLFSRNFLVDNEQRNTKACLSSRHSCPRFSISLVPLICSGETLCLFPMHNYTVLPLRKRFVAARRMPPTLSPTHSFHSSLLFTRPWSQLLTHNPSLSKTMTIVQSFTFPFTVTTPRIHTFRSRSSATASRISSWKSGARFSMTCHASRKLERDM